MYQLLSAPPTSSSSRCRTWCSSAIRASGSATRWRWPARPRRGWGLAAELVGIVYAHHPLFAGTKSLYRPGLEPLHGGDLLLAAPGVIAAGCLPPGAERLARRVFDAGLAHTVLVVPLGRPDRRLDTACTMLSADTVLMRPATAYSLTARVLTPGGDGPRVSHPQAFLAGAAAAAGLDRLRLVETGFGAAAASREQWDDAGNLLVLAPGLAVSYERNVATQARLERMRLRGDHRAGQRAVRRPGRSAQPVLPGEQGSGAARGRLIHRTLRMRSA